MLPAACTIKEPVEPRFKRGDLRADPTVHRGDLYGREPKAARPFRFYSYLFTVQSKPASRPPHCRQPSATPPAPFRRETTSTARARHWTRSVVFAPERAATGPAPGAPLPGPAMSRGHTSASGGCVSAGPPLSAPLPLPARVPPQRQPPIHARPHHRRHGRIGRVGRRD